MITIGFALGSRKRMIFAMSSSAIATQPAVKDPGFRQIGKGKRGQVLGFEYVW